MTDPAQQTPRKSGCLRWFLITGGIAGLFLLIIGILVWQTFSWYTNFPEPAAASYPPMQLSEGEQEDVQRVIGKLWNPKSAGDTVNEFMSATVVNGVIEQILEGERSKPHGEDVPKLIRLQIADGVISFKAVFVPKDDLKKYAKPGDVLVVEGKVAIEIAGREIKNISASDITVHGQPAPLLARIAISMGLDKAKKESHAHVDSPDNGLAAIELLKVEGDRLHVILDSKKMAEQNARNEKKRMQEAESNRPPAKKPEEPREF